MYDYMVPSVARSSNGRITMAQPIGSNGRITMAQLYETHPVVTGLLEPQASLSHRPPGATGLLELRLHGRSAHTCTGTSGCVHTHGLASMKRTHACIDEIERMRTCTANW